MKNQLVIFLTLFITFTSCIEKHVSKNDKSYTANNSKNNSNWIVRYNNPKTRDFFSGSTSKNGLTFEAQSVNEIAQNLSAYYHFRLESPINNLSFIYRNEGEIKSVPIELLDAAGNVLWKFVGEQETPITVKLENLKVRGQLIFRVWKDEKVNDNTLISHVVSNIKYSVDSTKPNIEKDGFILVDNLSEFRGYAAENDIKIRLKSGSYTINKAFCTRFLELSGDNCEYDLSGVRIMVDTKLFINKELARGNSEKSLYCAIELSGSNTSMVGPYVETYGNYYGHQSKNKIFNLVGENVTLKNAEIRTSGSNPYGYGSFYGLGGKDVRKMNGIRIGYPGDKVRLIGCKVHMRAMGHAIFVQGAENTIIENCEVDGILKTTDDLLAEKSGYAFDHDFKAAKGGYLEGVYVGEDGTFLPGEMFSLSEDGIRIYTDTSPGHFTGTTTIKNCTVTNMRRGICTGLNAIGDRVINCKVTNCVAAGFNVGNNDRLVNCSADAKYSEALSLPYNNANGASIELEVLDSRNGMNNNLLAVINGRNNYVNLKTSNEDYVPDVFKIELSSNNGYAFYQGSNIGAVDIQLKNKTAAKVILLPGTVNQKIESKSEIIDKIKLK